MGLVGLVGPVGAVDLVGPMYVDILGKCYFGSIL